MRRLGAFFLLAACVAPSAPVAFAMDDVKKPGTRFVPLRVRLLEIEGVAWRTDLHGALTLVDAKGTTTVWTTDGKTLGSLFARSSSEATIVAGEGVDEEAPPPPTVKYVASFQLTRRPAPGRLNGVAFVPTNDSLKNGTECEVSGRREGEEGVLATLAVRDSRLIEMHSVAVRETLPHGPGSRGSSTTVSATYQLPEVVTATVNGAWHIPTNGVLLIGMGVHSMPDPATRRSVLHERLVVIDAKDLDENAFNVSRSLAASTSKSTSRVSGPPAVLIWAAVLTIGFLSLGVIAWSLGWGRASE